MNVTTAISSNLRVLRNIFDYTKEEVAQKTGYADYAAAEDGKAEPSISQLIAISDLYDIDIDKIVREPLTNFIFRSAHYDCLDDKRLPSRHQN